MTKGKFGIQLPQLTTKAKVIVVLVVLFFIASLATLIITSLQAGWLTGSDGTVSKAEFQKQSLSDRKDNAQKAATDAVSGGSDETAAKIYKNAIDAETNDIAKVQLASDQADLLFAAGNQDEAIAVLKQALDYSKDKYLAYDRLARMYESAKLYADAAANYEQAGKLVDSPANVGKYTKNFYDSRAAKMRQLASNG